MTDISTDAVRRLTQLSAIDVSDEEAAGLGRDIRDILTYIEQLNELDTEGVEPSYQVNDRSNVWREDEVANEPTTRDQLLALAPAAQADQVKVPKVL